MSQLSKPCNPPPTQSDKLEVLAANRLDEKFDASPAAAGKDLFLRGREYLYCLTEK